MIIILFIFLSSISLSQTRYFIQQYGVGNGGGILVTSNYKIFASVGLPWSGSTSGDNYIISSGFWHSNVVTDVEISSKIPDFYQLKQNYPNPFNPRTVIEYAIPEESKVTIKIYNVLGQEVSTLVNGIEQAGFYKVLWEPKDLSSGAYFCVMLAKSEKRGLFVEVKKLIYTK